MSTPPELGKDGDTIMSGVAEDGTAKSTVGDSSAGDIEALSAAVREAYSEAERQAVLRETDVAAWQKRVSAVIAEVTALRSHVKDLESGLGEGKKTSERLVEAETVAGNLRAELEKERAAREVLDAEATRAREREVKDAALIAKLEGKVVDVERSNVTMEGKLGELQGELASTRREGLERSDEDEAAKKRLEFLEKERVRLEGEAAEARSLHEIAVRARKTEAETMLKRETSTRSELEAVRADLEESQRRARVSDEQAADLRRQVVDLQTVRERAQTDHQREIESLNAQLEIHRENQVDTETRFREFKEVIAGMNETMKAKDARAVQAGGLGGHADALLRHVQSELDARVDDLERSREEFEASKASERKMALALEALRRESETSVAAAEDAETRARTAEESLQEALRRCDRLERRVMLAGSVSGMGRVVGAPGSVPLVSAADGGGPVMMMDVGDDGMDRSPAGHRMTPTPSKFSLDAHLDEVVALRQRHDELVASIAAQRDMYRKQSTLRDF